LADFHRFNFLPLCSLVRISRSFQVFADAGNQRDLQKNSIGAGKPSRLEASSDRPTTRPWLCQNRIGHSHSDTLVDCRWDSAGHARRAGFALIERLVVNAIIAVLIDLVLLAVQVSRETVHRSQCLYQRRRSDAAESDASSASGLYRCPSDTYPASFLGITGIDGFLTCRLTMFHSHCVSDAIFCKVSTVPVKECGLDDGGIGDLHNGELFRRIRPFGTPDATP
jgi:hypothetical protein